jgi:bisphosphoglycerate-dependent phosphoglycerate mutase
MYGSLTGLSKKMIRQIHGNEQFMKWRRGYETAPPPISSFSHAYPGNDERYTTYAQDIPISLFETMIRSLAHGRLEIHRNFPKAESLKDCMERTIPYYRDFILPQSINKGQNVMIASSENAIRGLLMYLCNIPAHEIPHVEIPTGLPLIFDPRVNRIRLLEEIPETTDPISFNQNILHPSHHNSHTHTHTHQHPHTQHSSHPPHTQYSSSQLHTQLINNNESPFKKYNFGDSLQMLFKPDFITTEEFETIINTPLSSSSGATRSHLKYDPIIRLK